jgi:hypothetical protein
VLDTLAVAALICAAAFVVGEALARVLRLGRSRTWSPAVGLAVVLGVALAAQRLPSHGEAGAIALAALLAISLLVVVLHGGVPRPSPEALGVTATTAIAAAIPYLSNGRFGILAVSYTNDPAAHLAWAQSLRDLPAAQSVTTGYPIGPHSLLAAIAEGTGIHMDWVLMGLLFSLPILIAWAALSLLDGLSPLRRALAATLVTVAYVVSAFYAQAGFKELLLTLFLLAMAGIAREYARVERPSPWLGTGLQIGALAGGIVVSFSYGGLAWPAGIAVGWIGLALAAVLLDRQPGRRSLARATDQIKRWWKVLAAGAVAAALTVVSDISRILDSFQVFGASPSGRGTIVTTNIGHLQGQVPKREIFGFWPREDFRFGVEHTLLTEALLVLALAVAAYGLIWLMWRRDLLLPAAAIATVLISAYLARVESAYTASKALPPAGAFVMLVGIRALLADRAPIRGSWVRPALVVAAVPFVAGALYSSFLVLRGAEVGPREHRDEIASLRDDVLGGTVLFLGNDDYIFWQLYGVPVTAVPGTRPEKRYEVGQPFDFDSVVPDTVNASGFTISTRTAYRSEPPPGLRRVRTTRSFELWSLQRPVAKRHTLPEGFEPGATLDCSTGRGSRLAARTGWARIWTDPPAFRSLHGTPASMIDPGEAQTVSMRLGAGRWELSLQYISRRGISVETGGEVVGRMPANLDRPGPLWRIGEVEQTRPGRRTIRLSVDDDPIGSTNHVALPTGIAAVRLDSRRELVPLREACGRYVDWYTLGPARPRV